MRLSIKIKWTVFISFIILFAYVVVSYVSIDTLRSVASEHVTYNFIFKIIIIGVVVLIAGIVVSYVSVSTVLRSIYSINDTVDRINKKPDSDARIKLKRDKDEIYDLTVNINKMLDRMQNYTNQQKEFVGNVSHELRTPVAVLNGHLSMLQRWGKDDPKILEDSINSSLQELKRMESLIQEMLDLTRIEQIDEDYLNQVTEAKPLFDQIYNDFVLLHPDFHINFDNDVRDGSFVKIYRNHLEQIVIILLDNAFKYSKDRKEINFSTSTNSNELEVAIQDFGQGIPKKDLKQIFNRFYRVDKARSRQQGGNGLGLSIAKRLVEVYKGTLTVESVEGSGTVFKLELPLKIVETDK
ncbi:sensor histidine kinase [Companilactobacillus metriopterae]|uniref:sensor histidine kinase n=1 Tax=Companilactobacillus metriopterae TaxID=1909267 RepID=UPI00100B4032|nr:HAMP domain-containing sensor histidine kinase [Companilactobacillus metriopterae]